MVVDILEGMEYMKRSGFRDNRVVYIVFYFVGFGEKSKVKKFFLKLVNVNVKFMKEVSVKYSKMFIGERMELVLY